MQELFLHPVVSAHASHAPVCCWDVGQRLGGQLERTKGLTVPNLAHSLPQPFLCASHPVFRFQATYLSNLRGVTPRPAGSFRPQLSFPPSFQEESRAGSGLCCLLHCRAWITSWHLHRALWELGCIPQGPTAQPLGSCSPQGTAPHIPRVPLDGALTAHPTQLPRAQAGRRRSAAL